MDYRSLKSAWRLELLRHRHEINRLLAEVDRLPDLDPPATSTQQAVAEALSTLPAADHWPARELHHRIAPLVPGVGQRRLAQMLRQLGWISGRAASGMLWSPPSGQDPAV